jgi:hypothetical protein
MPDVGHLFGNMAARPQASTKVTDSSPHVDGGQGGSAGSNAAAEPDERAVLHVAVAIILIALILLWGMGALAFKGARL